MEIAGWNERYRSRERSKEDIEGEATQLLRETAGTRPPGRALDLASGAGRNTLWLARNGWQVTAIDGASAAIEILRRRAHEAALTIDAQIADLKTESFKLESSAFDLVAICYYLQRDLFPSAKEAVKPDGILLAIAHITEGREEPNENRLRPGELRSFFNDWQILHDFEGKPADPAHKRAVAEIVARRPR